AVVGGDGAGKSTVARTMVGLAVPESGSVVAPPAEQIGYLPASSGVWPDLTVLENLEFVADAHRIGRAERKSRFARLIETAGLDGATDRLGGHLSGGMRQKLGITMAILSHPRLLVLDEPSTGVDPVSRTEMWSLITAAALDGTAVLFTTTYLDEAERAHTVTALDDGRVFASGSIDEIAAAVPGSIVSGRGEPARSWRRGQEWRSWHPVPDYGEAKTHDLTDLLVAAALAREEQQG
ncbi:MAG: ABC transporter ATP-binding protein, partial [Acidimicrobiia bacterium]|nr:ABC transporter ATP-binding protein [Acidimicrobiia bacterium]